MLIMERLGDAQDAARGPRVSARTGEGRGRRWRDAQSANAGIERRLGAFRSRHNDRRADWMMWTSSWGCCRAGGAAVAVEAMRAEGAWAGRGRRRDGRVGVLKRTMKRLSCCTSDFEGAWVETESERRTRPGADGANERRVSRSLDCSLCSGLTLCSSSCCTVERAGGSRERAKLSKGVQARMRTTAKRVGARVREGMMERGRVYGTARRGAERERGMVGTGGERRGWRRRCRKPTLLADLDQPPRARALALTPLRHRTRAHAALLLLR